MVPGEGTARLSFVARESCGRKILQAKASLVHDD